MVLLENFYWVLIFGLLLLQCLKLGMKLEVCSPGAFI